MSFLTLDIETVPQPRFVDPERWTSGDIELVSDWEKDREHDAGVIRLAIEEGKAPLSATKIAPALHASTCHVVQVSFGWRTTANGEPAFCARVLQVDHFFPETGTLFEKIASAERLVIAEALGMISSACAKRSTVVSFNGKGFDVPVLRGRAALLGLTVPSIPWRRLLYPFSDEQHADLRLILGNDDRRANGTLQWWADAFGIHAEEHGAEVFAWVQAGEWEKLNQYGLTEAQTLVELYERLQAVL